MPPARGSGISAGSAGGPWTPSADGDSASRSAPPAWRARPKSMTRTLPSRPTITLSGLKSRWTRPASWAAARPRPGGHEDAQHLAPVALVGVQPVADGVTVDELHRDEDRFVERSDVVDHHHVAVRQLGDRLRLAQQAGAPLRGALAGAGSRAQQLERDLAVQLGIVGRVDVAHPPASHQRQDNVPPDRRASGQNVGRFTGDLAVLLGWHRRTLPSEESAGSICGLSMETISIY